MRQNGSWESYRQLPAAGERVHLVGVGGAGMSGLAVLLAARGLNVDGCDVSGSSEYAERLNQHRIPSFSGHDAGHVRGASLLIRTAAVPADAPEVAAAVAQDIPVLTRGEVLPLLLRDVFSVAICGTHGKTTTTTFSATLISQALGARAGWYIGGRSDSLPVGVRAGEVLVAEADESDGTLRGYVADVLVVTNVEFDHMEHFDSVEAFEACFACAAQAARKRVVVCADDARAMRVTSHAKRRLSYGFSPDADLRILDCEILEDSTRFSLVRQGVSLGAWCLPVGGRHNVLNAVAALAAAWACGVDLARSRDLMATLSLPARRFERRRLSGGVDLINDYAHHPTEIKALLAMSRTRFADRRTIACFQPHRYTRTRALCAELAASFDDVDELILLPVYAASERYLPGGGIEDLYEAIRQRGQCRVSLVESVAEAGAALALTVRDRDVLLVVGAGDVGELASRNPLDEGVAAREQALPTHVSPNVSAGKRSSLRVGGNVQWAGAPAEETELREMLTWASACKLPVRVFGAGSNILISDLGVGGLAIWLDAPAFCDITVQGTEVRAGAGISGAALLTACERAGCSGLEFLEGIPGRLGGLVAMNAGAYGGEMASAIKTIRVLSSDGQPDILDPNDLVWGAHQCTDLADKIILSVTFELVATGAEAVRIRRQTLREKRAWWKGRRTAGSVFRNPPETSAGRVLEAAGCKGKRIGAAWVSRAHANVIEVEGEATASDVRALLRWMRRKARADAGVDLQREVRVIW